MEKDHAPLLRQPSLSKLPPPVIRVMSYNIRYEHDGEKPGHHWKDRRELLVKTIRDRRPHVLCLQEAKEGQMQYLAEQLHDYQWVGRPRDSTPDAEYSSIFFSSERFSMQANYTFWLSDQPERPGYVSWKGLPRVCTWVLLRDNFDGKWFAVYNTHLDWESEQARVKSLSLIQWRMNDLYRQHYCQLPMILTGDLNAPPEAKEVQSLTDSRDAPQRELRLQNTSDVAQTRAGPRGTFVGSSWHTSVAYDMPNTIDYIFVNKHIAVDRFEVCAEPKDKHTASDHLPIFADISFI